MSMQSKLLPGAKPDPGSKKCRRFAGAGRGEGGRVKGEGKNEVWYNRERYGENRKGRGRTGVAASWATIK